ncbi:hypothetical protein GC169_00305 [bacterium]|nr:hypothetical protein [bacterium]
MSKWVLSALVLALGASGCATSPARPADLDDACAMLQDNKEWYRDLRRSAKRWGAPIGLQLAIIRQESNFDSKARPARGDRRMLGLLPGKRPSDAYGYAQALESTWEQYKKESGNEWSSRTDFGDATDFIGWYVDTTGRVAGVDQYNFKAHYLAYHEGQGGYMRGSYRSKAWLIQVADRVAANGKRYEAQVRSCKGLGGFWPF